MRLYTHKEEIKRHVAFSVWETCSTTERARVRVPNFFWKTIKKKCNQQGWCQVASIPLPYTTIRNEFRVLTCLSVSVALKLGFQVQSGLVVPRCTPGLTIRRRTSCLSLGREPNACLGPVDTPPRSGFFFSFLISGNSALGSEWPDSFQHCATSPEES